MRSKWSGRGMAGILATAVGAVAVSGCELTGVLIEHPGSVIFAEVQAVVLADEGGVDVLDAFAVLHPTLGGEVEDYVAAEVRITGESGVSVRLVEQDGELCLYVPEVVWPKATGSCHRTRMSPSPFAPGERVTLEIATPDGERLLSTSSVPGAFSFDDLTQEGGSCRMEPGTNLRFQWSRADGAWGYWVDALIAELEAGFAGPDLKVPEALHLTGRALGPQDTAIAFPRDFGLSEFIENKSKRELVRALLDLGGLPEGARAEIAFTAADRNWTNWFRGETLDPTRPRCIPSVSGDGTGWFGTGTQLRVKISTSAASGEGQPPSCGPAVPAGAGADGTGEAPTA